VSDTEKLIAVKSEVQLLGWSETSTRGRTVTFNLPMDETTHPFKDYAIKSGKQAGHRFMMVLVEIDDQDQPVKQVARLSQQAAVLCKDRQFWQWAGERSISDINSEDDARSWLLNGCGITSRSQFDTSRTAADWLQHMVITPYRDYLDNISEGIMP
jgi:hypothetical protein